MFNSEPVRDVAGIDERPRLVVICGPTASGKTRLALTLDESFSVEVVSADSRQVYRGMDIGTAKATLAERQRVPHHLLDVVPPDQDFSVADFVKLAGPAITEIRGRGRLPLLVGGTGLYIRALISGLIDAPGEDPALRQRLQNEEFRGGEGTLFRKLEEVDPGAAQAIHPRNLVRIIRALEVLELTGRPMSAWQADHRFTDCPYRLLTFGMNIAPEVLQSRIAERVGDMLEQGLLAEVEGLLAAGYQSGLKAMQTIGYRETVAFLAGHHTAEEMRSEIVRNTRRYAKRQGTWFRRDKSIIWVDSLRESARILSSIDDFMND